MKSNIAGASYDWRPRPCINIRLFVDVSAIHRLHIVFTCGNYVVNHSLSENTKHTFKVVRDPFSLKETFYSLSFFCRFLFTFFLTFLLRNGILCQVFDCRHTNWIYIVTTTVSLLLISKFYLFSSAVSQIGTHCYWMIRWYQRFLVICDHHYRVQMLNIVQNLKYKYSNDKNCIDVLIVQGQWWWWWRSKNGFIVRWI